MGSQGTCTRDFPFPFFLAFIQQAMATANRQRTCSFRFSFFGFLPNLEVTQDLRLDMTLKERLEWLTRMTLLVFILASAAFLSAITAMRIAIHGREVTMPHLVGKNVSEASKMLQSRGLVLRVADRIYSDQPINVVLRQTPTAGLLMKVSQQAHVVLSLGQHQLQIPLLEGNSLRASRVELLRQGLQVGEVSAINKPDEPVDTIVIQNPT